MDDSEVSPIILPAANYTEASTPHSIEKNCNTTCQLLNKATTDPIANKLNTQNVGQRRDRQYAVKKSTESKITKKSKPLQIKVNVIREIGKHWFKTVRTDKKAGAEIESNIPPEEKPVSVKPRTKKDEVPLKTEINKSTESKDKNIAKPLQIKVKVIREIGTHWLNTNKEEEETDGNIENIVSRKKKPRVRAELKHTKDKLPLKMKINIKKSRASTLLELDKHRYNIRTIMRLSNATPIRTHYLGNGYACCFCDKFFSKAADLKTHTIHKHDNKEKNKFMQKSFLSTFVVKLDITALSCNLCEVKLDTLEELTKHLNEAHGESLYTDIKNQTVCFKLDDGVMKCMFCQLQFASFKYLLKHMNQHYRNFVCKECNAGFVNQSMLASHADGHKLGKFECESCKKVFDRLSSYKYHIGTAHSALKRHKCYQCGEKFSTMKVKMDHMKNVHAAEFTKVQCLACDRTFNDKNMLRIHTQRDHLLERRFVCEICDKSFFTSGMLKNHMVTHTGSREFKCAVCGKDFARKKTLQTHMRTHFDGGSLHCRICKKGFLKQSTLDVHMRLHAGNFQCEVCPESFNELSGLQTHMMTCHGIIM